MVRHRIEVVFSQRHHAAWLVFARLLNRTDHPKTNICLSRGQLDVGVFLCEQTSEKGFSERSVGNAQLSCGRLETQTVATDQKIVGSGWGICSFVTWSRIDSTLDDSYFSAAIAGRRFAMLFWCQYWWTKAPSFTTPKKFGRTQQSGPSPFLPGFWIRQCTLTTVSAEAMPSVSVTDSTLTR